MSPMLIMTERFPIDRFYIWMGLMAVYFGCRNQSRYQRSHLRFSLITTLGRVCL